MGLGGGRAIKRPPEGTGGRGENGVPPPTVGNFPFSHSQILNNFPFSHFLGILRIGGGGNAYGLVPIDIEA